MWPFLNPTIEVVTFRLHGKKNLLLAWVQQHTSTTSRKVVNIFACWWHTRVRSRTGARIAQLVVCWARCPAWRSSAGLTLCWASSRGDYPLAVNMGSASIPPPPSKKKKKSSFGWEYRPKSSLCAHAFHRTDSKDPDIHVIDKWIPATKTPPACTVHEDRMWLPLWLN